MQLYNFSIPKDGFTGYGTEKEYQAKAVDTSHNVASTSAYAIYRLGTKIGYYNETLGGYGACIYLQYSAGAETLAAGYPVGIDEANDTLYSVTGDQSTIGDGSPTAIALSAMTTAYYGWFWCAGVCPDFYTSSSAKFAATTVTTNDSIAAGKAFEMPLSTTDGIIHLWATAASTRIGYALADDGGTTTDMANLVLFDTWS